MKARAIKNIYLKVSQTKFRFPVRHAAQKRLFNDTVLVAIEDHAGRFGYGECLPRPYVTGETIESVTTYIEKTLKPALVNKDLVSEQLQTHLHTLYREASLHKALCAFSGVDVAAHDLMRNQGMYPDHLPAKNAYQVPTTFTIPLGWPISMTMWLAKLRGFHDFKIKVDTLNQIEGLRIPSGTRVRLDANGAFAGNAKTIQTLAEILPPGIWGIEAPFAGCDLASMAALQKSTSCHVIADESLCTYEDAEQHLQHEAARVWNLRLGKNGGVTGVKALFALARNHHIPCGLGVLVGETRALTEAHARLASQLSLCFVEHGFTRWLIREDPLKSFARNKKTLSPL